MGVHPEPVAVVPGRGSRRQQRRDPLVLVSLSCTGRSIAPEPPHLFSTSFLAGACPSCSFSESAVKRWSELVIQLEISPTQVFRVRLSGCADRGSAGEEGGRGFGLLGGLQSVRPRWLRRTGGSAPVVICEVAIAASVEAGSRCSERSRNPAAPSVRKQGASAARPSGSRSAGGLPRRCSSPPRAGVACAASSRASSASATALRWPDDRGLGVRRSLLHRQSAGGLQPISRFAPPRPVRLAEGGAAKVVWLRWSQRCGGHGRFVSLREALGRIGCAPLVRAGSIEHG